MRLATLQIDGESTAAIQVDGGYLRLPAADVGALLLTENWRDLAEARLADAHSDDAHRDDAPRDDAPRDALTIPTAQAQLLTLVPHPGKVFCAGLNYSDHILEMGRELPEFPTLFAKFADTLTGPFDDLVFDGTSQSIDWEAELTVVIGSTISRGSREDALAAIAGYTVANDISMRDWQMRTLQWLQGKAFDRSTPVGPVMVTPDEVDPAAGLAISCTVNGEVMQNGSTSTLVFDAAALVAYISTFATLRPGDLVLTGTPGGVGSGRKPPRYLSDGDLVVTAIEGIGELRNVVRISQ